MSNEVNKMKQHLTENNNQDNYDLKNKFVVQDVQGKELFKVFLKEKFLEIILNGGSDCIKRLESIIKQNSKNR